MALIEAEDVWVKYRMGKDYALRGVSIRIDQGDIVGIIGPTGAGKTTLAKTLCGIVPHIGAYDDFKGTIRVGGLNSRDHKVGELSRLCGMVFQDYETQLFRTTVELEVAFGPENLGLSREDMVRRIREGLALTNLVGLEKRYTFALSGGQKQRLAIASMLSLLPSVLILDEATSDLDPAGKSDVYHVVRSLIDQKRVKALVLIDHHLERVAEFANRVILMSDGQIVRDSLPAEVLSDVELIESLKLAPIQVVKILHGLGLKRSSAPINIGEASKIFSRPLATKKPPDQPSPPNSGTAIRLNDMWFRYEPQEWVIQGLSLDVGKGSFLGLIGQNGSGKTTLAQLIMGILLPHRGTIEIFGKDVTRRGVMIRGKEVGYVFQNPDYQIFSQTVREELAYGPRNTGLPKDEVERRVRITAEMLGLVDLLNEDPFFLSKADRQRVAVASVLTLNPKIVILDEPTTGLSPAETEALMDLAKGLNKQGTTVITISHDMWVITKYCERTVLMSQGQIIVDGPTREVFAKTDVLKNNRIDPPQVVELSNTLFGVTYLTPEEFLENVRIG